MIRVFDLLECDELVRELIAHDRDTRPMDARPTPRIYQRGEFIPVDYHAGPLAVYSESPENEIRFEFPDGLPPWGISITIHTRAWSWGLRFGPGCKRYVRFVPTSKHAESFDQPPQPEQNPQV